MTEENFSICYHHSTSLAILTKLKKSLTDEKQIESIKEVIENIKIAKRAGVRMEKRLRRYFDAITMLGFTRKKKGK